MSLSERHLRAFVAVAEELHFGNAAARLFVAQPALTSTIQQLERQLGVRLFNRTTRTVELSPAGLEVLADARRALAAIEGMKETATRYAGGEARVLRLGYLVGAGIELIPGLVRRFRDAMPGVVLETREFDFSDPTAGLSRQIVDAAIIRPPIDAADVDVQLVSFERRIAVLPSSHPLADRTEVSVSELLDDPIVAAPESAGGWRDYWILEDHRDGTPAVIGGEAATREAELQAVALGRGISVTSESSARFFDRPGVVYIPIVDLEPCAVALAWRAELGSTPGIALLRSLAVELARAAEVGSL